MREPLKYFSSSCPSLHFSLFYFCFFIIWLPGLLLHQLPINNIFFSISDSPDCEFSCSRAQLIMTKKNTRFIFQTDKYKTGNRHFYHMQIHKTCFDEGIPNIVREHIHILTAFQPLRCLFTWLLAVVYLIPTGSSSTLPFSFCR